MIGEWPFTDPITGCQVTLVIAGHRYGDASVRHGDCPQLADVAPALDAFYCTALPLERQDHRRVVLRPVDHRMSGDDPRLRIRVWVNMQLVDETWIDASNPDAVSIVDAAQRRHEALTDQADADGRTWLVEVYDPDQPPERAHLRFGTDPGGMVEPTPFS